MGRVLGVLRLLLRWWRLCLLLIVPRVRVSIVLRRRKRGLLAAEWICWRRRRVKGQSPHLLMDIGSRADMRLVWTGLLVDLDASHVLE